MECRDAFTMCHKLDALHKNLNLKNFEIHETFTYYAIIENNTLLKNASSFCTFPFPTALSKNI